MVVGALVNARNIPPAPRPVSSWKQEILVSRASADVAYRATRGLSLLDFYFFALQRFFLRSVSIVFDIDD